MTDDLKTAPDQAPTDQHDKLMALSELKKDFHKETLLFSNKEAELMFIILLRGHNKC